MKVVVTVGNRVVLGPIAPNVNYITTVLAMREGIQIALDADDLASFPFVSGEVTIREAEEAYPEHNPLVERLEGPFWTFTESKGTATFTVGDKPLFLVQGELKEKVAAERYNREIAGTKLTVQSQEVTIETDRDSRNTFVQTALLLPDTATTVWKFPKDNIWLTLTKLDLMTIVQAGMAYIQSCFQWESTQVELIEAATTKQDILDLYASIFPPPTMPDNNRPV